MDIDHKAIIQTYLAESEEQLGQIEEALVILEIRPYDKETVETIFRAAHTLKGNASTMGFALVAEFAHAVEDVLQRLRKRTIPVTSGLISLLLRAVDALRQMVHDALAGVEEIEPVHGELLKQLTGTAPVAAEEEKPAEISGEDNQKGLMGEKAEPNQTWTDRGRSLRVDIERLDRMLNLSSEITVAQGRLRQILEEKVGRIGQEVLEAHETVEHLWLGLQEEIMKVRMVPVGPTFRQYIRTVRDIAKTHGKIVRLVIEGGEVEVDTKVIEYLKDPLTHMIRNAVDHGIEPPEIRKARGKDPCGLIALRAYHDTGNIVIQVEDNGAGFDRQRILEKALARGLISGGEKLSTEEIYRLVFVPGFSTAEIVTDLSGRGVGMDIVEKNVEGLRGSLAIDSREGEGTTITVRLPLTLAIIEGLRVGVGEESYVIPLDSVIECLDLPEEERRRASGRGVINLRGEVLPYLRLRDVFELGGNALQRENIVVVKHEGRQVGLVVDALHGESQAVIKPLGKLFQGHPGVSASTILGNGRVALILDVLGLVGLARATRETAPSEMARMAIGQN